MSRQLQILALCAALNAVSVYGAGSQAPVADAAMRGDGAAVRSLLQGGADVNAAQGDGMTALHWSASNEDIALARMLLFAGANVRATTRLNAVTPLWMAAQTGNADMVGLLLDGAAPTNAATANGVTPLMMAAASGNVTAIDALLDHGADVNAHEQAYGQTALMFAANFDRPDAAQRLIRRGADIGATTRVRMPPARRPAPSAAAAPAAPAGAAPAAPAAAPPAQATGAPPVGGDTPDPALAAIDAMPTAKPEPMGGLNALHYAVRQGHVTTVDALLAQGADINSTSADNTTPLMLALVNGHFDLAMHLLDRGADPAIATLAGGTPLYRVLDVYWAPKAFYPQPDTRQAQIGYLDLMRALLEHGADPNARLKSELWYTAYGFGLEGISPAGATPFWRAAQVGDVYAMRLLAAHGADPAIGTDEGISPLMVLAGAGFHGNDAITIPAGRMPAMRYLVEELGADVNAIDEKAGKVTHIEHQNTRGYTAIHNAAARGDNEMIRYLVSKGARVDLVGENGMTSVDMANSPRERIEPFPETIALLMSLGAKNSNKCVSC